MPPPKSRPAIERRRRSTPSAAGSPRGPPGSRTGRSSRRAGPPRPRARAGAGATPSTASSWPGSTARAGRLRPRRRADAHPPPVARPDSACRRRPTRSMPSSTTRGPTPTNASSIACWPARGWASAWPTTGSTRPAMPTRTATSPTAIASCGPGATGRSGRSTRTCRSTASRSSRPPATCSPARRAEQKIATGFHRNHPLNGEGGRVAEESRVDYVVDRVDTTGTVFLGLTVGCAGATTTSTTR